MRVAIVSHHKSLGGGSRFVQGLLQGLGPHVGERVSELVLFLRSGAPETAAFEAAGLGGPRLKLHLVDDNGCDVESRARRPSLRARLREKPCLAATYRFIKFRVLRQRQEEASPQFAIGADILRELEGFDVVYVTWPRLLEPLDIDVPVVATFHDFNYRHGFAVFTQEERAFLDEEAEEWLRGRVFPVVSTPFIGHELDRFYPGRTNAPSVVYLSSFVLTEPSHVESAEVVQRHGLSDDYIHCPTNIGPHKNLVRLINAYGALRREGYLPTLVFTGGGTHMIGRDPEGDWLYGTPLRGSIDAINQAITANGLTLGVDFLSLGYVSDREVDAIVAGASLVVAPSLYEAGTGPGLDAWKVGTAVAVSALQCVREQMEFLGTQAELFDPTDEADIARAIRLLSEDAGLRGRMATASREAMRRYDWPGVAAGYLDVFQDAISSWGSRSGPCG